MAKIIAKPVIQPKPQPAIVVQPSKPVSPEVAKRIAYLESELKTWGGVNNYIADKARKELAQLRQ